MKTTKDRFMEHVLLIPETTCWYWKGYLNQDGYGSFRIGNKVLKAHRVSHSLFKGDVLDKQILHSCDNPSCVNPEHLWMGTVSDNMKDMWNKKRHPKPNNAHKAKLTLDQVAHIRSMEGKVSGLQLSKEYSVNDQSIRNIWIGVTWNQDRKDLP